MDSNKKIYYSECPVFEDLVEEPVSENLEEEIKRYFNSMTPEQFLNTPNAVVASHFAEWGKEHLK